MNTLIEPGSGAGFARTFLKFMDGHNIKVVKSASVADSCQIRLPLDLVFSIIQMQMENKEYA
jgi:ribosomal protein S4E